VPRGGGRGEPRYGKSYHRTSDPRAYRGSAQAGQGAREARQRVVSPPGHDDIRPRFDAAQTTTGRALQLASRKFIDSPGELTSGTLEEVIGCLALGRTICWRARGLPPAPPPGRQLKTKDAMRLYRTVGACCRATLPSPPQLRLVSQSERERERERESHTWDA
jgi:hypothetical protein